MNEIFDDALKHVGLFLALKNGKNITHAKLQGVKLDFSWETAVMEIHEKIKSVRFVSGARKCHGHNLCATTFFFFAKKEWPEEARCSIQRLTAIISSRPEPGPDPNIVCATRPRSGTLARSGRGIDSGPCRPLA